MMIGNHHWSEEIQDKFVLQAMRDGLQFLTKEEQQALILKFIAKLPNKNIARVMSRREKQVRTLQFSALQKLTGYLQKKEIV
jgi:DNA-directed RNA polymerase specialized sigma24 family protein